MEFDLLVFDWDGTLMDSAAAIVHSLQAACRDLTLPIPSDGDARHVIGLGLPEALQYVAPNLSAERYPLLSARYRHHYLGDDHRLTLFAGIPALLNELNRRGFALAVATGKSRVGLERALEQSGLEAVFSVWRTADQCLSKPHPQMLEELMAEFDVRPERTLMIGDTTHDLDMARAAGTASVAVSYGAHPAAALLACQPLACFGDVGSLSDWLLRLTPPDMRR